MTSTGTAEATSPGATRRVIFALWVMNGGTVSSATNVSNVATVHRGPVAGQRDFDGDGRS